MCDNSRRQGGVMAPSGSNGDDGGHGAAEYIYKRTYKNVSEKELIAPKHTEYDAILEPYQPQN